jgi:hypothetical protein
MRRQSAVLLLLAWVLGARPQAARADEEPGAPKPSTAEPAAPPPAPYRYPAGSFAFSGGFGLALGNGSSAYALSLGVGYAVLTGVLPGIRGEVISASGVGGEFAGTLTLTPPISLYAVPFVLGEIGQRWDSVGSALFFRAGGGLTLGEPESHFALQLGWSIARYQYPAPVGNVDSNGPLIGIAFRP